MLGFFAFIPWNIFLSQHPALIVDQSKIKVAVSKDCNQINQNGMIEAVVASSDATRMKGLAGRKKQLAKNEGMLFVFESPQRVSFWMKDTLIPLQIAYFDAQGRLVKVYEMPVEKNPKKPLKTYPADVPTQTALEIKPKSISMMDDYKTHTLCVENPTRRRQ